MPQYAPSGFESLVGGLLGGYTQVSEIKSRKAADRRAEKVANAQIKSQQINDKMNAARGGYSISETAPSPMGSGGDAGRGGFFHQLGARLLEGLRGGPDSVDPTISIAKTGPSEQETMAGLQHGYRSDEQRTENEYTVARDRMQADSRMRELQTRGQQDWDQLNRKLEADAAQAAERNRIQMQLGRMSTAAQDRQSFSSRQAALHGMIQQYVAGNRNDPGAAYAQFKREHPDLMSEISPAQFNSAAMMELPERKAMIEQQKEAGRMKRAKMRSGKKGVEGMFEWALSGNDAGSKSGKLPLSARDKEMAKKDPEFAAMLDSVGYKAGVDY